MLRRHPGDLHNKLLTKDLFPWGDDALRVLCAALREYTHGILKVTFLLILLFSWHQRGREVKKLLAHMLVFGGAGGRDQLLPSMLIVDGELEFDCQNKHQQRLFL